MMEEEEEEKWQQQQFLQMFVIQSCSLAICQKLQTNF
jgi:hypothetical protein